MLDCAGIVSNVLGWFKADGILCSVLGKVVGCTAGFRPVAAAVDSLLADGRVAVRFTGGKASARGAAGGKVIGSFAELLAVAEGKPAEGKARVSVVAPGSSIGAASSDGTDGIAGSFDVDELVGNAPVMFDLAPSDPVLLDVLLSACLFSDAMFAEAPLGERPLDVGDFEAMLFCSNSF